MPELDDGSTRLRRRYRLVRRGSGTLVRACGAGCIFIGGLVLLGWIFDVPRLRSMVAGAVEMKANTAIALTLAGSALLLLSARNRDGQALMRSAQALGAAVAAIGGATGAEYLFGWDAGIDEALFLDLAGAYNKAKGRMSPYSALGFAIVGIGLAGLPVPRLRWLTQACAVAAALLGVVSLMGYVWGARELLTDEWAPPVAVHTAVGFILLGVGTLVARYRFPRGRASLRTLMDPVALKVIASFAGALLLLTAMGGMTYRAATQYSLYSRQLVDVKAFRGRLAEFYADVADAAFAQRTYLIAGEAKAFERWTRSVRQLALSRRLLEDSAHRIGMAERANFTALDQAVTRLVRVLDEGVQLQRRQGAEAARSFVQSGVCTNAMAAVRAALISMDTFERVEEEEHESELRASQQRTLQVTLLALVAAGAVLAAVFLAIRREMTRRAQAARGLRRRSTEALSANRFLESLIQNIPHMIFVKDAKDLRFVRVNRAGERLTGVREQDFVGKTDRDIYPPQQADYFIAKDREVLARGQILDIPTEELPAADGSVRVLHTKKIPLLDDAGRPTHLVGISEDVTDAREKERQITALNDALSARAEEVERVNRARSTFLATMSHEIRTPMNGMLGMLELLGLSPLDEKQRQTLYVVSESGQSLLRIIDDILDFSKIEAGKLELREEVASVASIMREVRNIHSAVASSKGLVIAVAVDSALSAAMWVDPLRLRQVLNNLVSNAVKFTSQGHVEMRAEVLAAGEGTQSLRLAVIDTGVGVPAGEQQRLFEPFVQAAPAGRGADGGTGLGLVISRRLAELMGGTLDMSSAVGQGTTMALVIPVRTAAIDLLPQPTARKIADLRQATERMRSVPSAAEAEAEGTLVLLVDDHPINRMLLEQQLNTLGYATETAHDGEEALGKWRQGRFGLVLTDCQMPGMTGYELARRIRELEAGAGRRHTPIVACTAMALPEETEKCLDSGMNDVLFKPVELRQMMEKLKRWLPLPARQPGAERIVDAQRLLNPARGVVDFAFLQATWGPDVKTIGAIVSAYARSAREDCAALRAAMGRRDLDAVRQVAHRMLGASKMVGAYGLAESCELVNTASREGNWQTLAVAMEAFDAEYARLMAGLSEPVD
jgi:PAS domain S-box-containing protein